MTGKTEQSSEDELEDLRNDPIMSKALDALRELSDDPHVRQLAEMREKSLINRRIMINETRAEALAEGESLGKAEERRTLVKKAAKSGMSAESIAALFELPLEEVTLALKV